MESYITSTLRLGKRISLVLWLIDQYTALGSDESDITVYLNGKPASFWRKAGGYLVFTELEDDLYQVAIEADPYLSEELTIRLSEIKQPDRIVPVAMKPSPVYRFNAGATLIRASVASTGGEPAAGAGLAVILENEKCARAKLGRQGAKAGALEMSLVDVTGRMAPGDLLLIRPPESIEGELCEIATMGVGEAVYGLKRPLQSDHARGELLMPVFTTRTDRRGEAVLACRNFRQPECRARIEVTATGDQQTQELNLLLGTVHYPEKIII